MATKDDEQAEAPALYTAPLHPLFSSTELWNPEEDKL